MKRLIFLLVVIGLVGGACQKKEPVLDFNQQLQKDDATIDAYLTSNSITATQDPSGLRYVTTFTGAGRKAGLRDRISAKYTLHLLDQTQLLDQGTFSIEVDSLIAGWQIAIPKMPKGSKFTLYIPSGLAYGPGGYGPIPPNANVVFEIELLDDDLQRATDVLAIDSYLLDTLHLPADTIHQDPSGIRYIFTVKGTGPKPILADLIVVAYTGKLLTTKMVFTEEPIERDIPLSTRMLGWQIALPLVPTGSKITLYLPSGLGYGPAGSRDGVVPPNTNLIYDIDLKF